MLSYSFPAVFRSFCLLIDHSTDLHLNSTSASPLLRHSIYVDHVIMFPFHICTVPICARSSPTLCLRGIFPASQQVCHVTQGRSEHKKWRGVRVTCLLDDMKCGHKFLHNLATEGLPGHSNKHNVARLNVEVTDVDHFMQIL